jgi:uncharacterized membrane protein YccF (DUF307 family)
MWMSVLGNIIWIIFGGLIGAIMWVIAGLICCLTIIGIPFGMQCFKLAQLQLAPFGRTVRSTGSGVGGLLGNVLWIIFIGWELALFNLIAALLFAVTIIGIPFAVQSIKLAGLSLMPFGKEIV